MNSVRKPCTEPRRSKRPPIRLLFLVLPLGFGLLLLIGALVVLASPSKLKPPPPGTEATAVVTAEETPVTPTTTPQTTPQPESPDQRVPTQTSAPADEVVAVVNGQTVGHHSLWVMQAADRAMTELLNQPVSSGDDVLDRLVNGELVRQAAQAASFVLEEDQVDQQLQDFLTSRGKSGADLESVLQANLGQWIAPLAALVIIIGIVGAMVIRRRPMA